MPLIIKEACGIGAAAQARERLLAALAAPDGATVDCSRVEEADVCMVQVLIAARRCAAAKGKELRFDPAPAGALLAAFERAGLAFDEI